MKPPIQQGNLRFDWGLAGLNSLLDSSEVIIIVDVLSFSTCVDIAVSRQAVVYPYYGSQEGARELAREKRAILAGNPGQETAFTLSAGSMQRLPVGSQVVLPSPNGSRLSLDTGAVLTLTGCLRNAAAVAGGARQLGSRITVIAAGERWPDGSLRPAVEDLLGAGAILSHLEGSRSVEAQMAEAAFHEARPRLEEIILRCVSGRELVDRGWGEDVHLASQLNVSEGRPLLEAGAYADFRFLERMEPYD